MIWKIIFLSKMIYYSRKKWEMLNLQFYIIEFLNQIFITSKIFFS